MPCYADVDPATGVLHGNKLGTGCNDAPRRFALKLAQVTRNLSGLKPITVEGELRFQHKPEGGRPKLVVIMHVDHAQLAGVREEVITVLQHIDKVFGNLKAEWNEFTNCGARRQPNKVTK